MTTTPAPSPRTLVSTIPSGLANVVMRCLSKSPDQRPASYADLAQALRPFSDRDDVPAPVGSRALAGLVDIVAVSLLSSMTQWWHDGPFRVSANFSNDVGTTLDVDQWAWLVGIIYFVVLEGVWGRSLGKRMFGLRVTANGAVPAWRQVAIRSVLYQFPSMVLALPVLLVGATTLAGWLSAHPVFTALLSPLPTILTALLFVSMRRRNGWATLHDLASGTRVVARHRGRAGASAGVASDGRTGNFAPAGPGERRGPFEVTAHLWERDGQRLMQGFDGLLQRRVWILERSVDAERFSVARREVRRPGRLHWLAGGEAPSVWDAFEAPEGAPLSEISHSVWHQTADVLLGLTDELAAGAGDGTQPHLAIDRVWIRDDGRAVLLDFVAPGAEPIDAESLSPHQLLSKVASHLSPTRQRHESPLPLSATTVLTKMASSNPGSLNDTRLMLADAARSPDRVPRSKRFLPGAAVLAPLVLLMIAVVLTATLIRNFATPQNVTMTGLLVSVESLEPETRAAVERYIASEYRDVLGSREFWSTLVIQGSLESLEPSTGALLARHPTVSEEQLALDRPLVEPVLAQAGTAYATQVEPAMRRMAVTVLGALAGVLVGFGLFGTVLSALVVPGGIVIRGLGLAVVRGDGRQIGRIRSVARVLVGWSPAILWALSLGKAPVDRLAAADLFTVVGFAVALGLSVTGVVWTVVKPERGLHDWVMGTWVVPR